MLPQSTEESTGVAVSKMASFTCQALNGGCGLEPLNSSPCGLSSRLLHIIVIQHRGIRVPRKQAPMHEGLSSFCYVSFANIQLAKARHMIKSQVNMGRDYYEGLDTRRCDSLGTINVTIYHIYHMTKKIYWNSGSSSVKWRDGTELTLRSCYHLWLGNR